MKEKILFIVLCCIAVIIGLGIYNYGAFLLDKGQNNLSSGSWYANSETLAGSSSNLVSLPHEAVFADATTTPPSGEYGMADGGKVIDQLINTEGYDKILLNISAIGPTSTSTMHIRQMGSFDGTSPYFDLGTSTEIYFLPPTAPTEVATTTLLNSPRSWKYDPSTATTTLSRVFVTEGHRYTRFIMWSDGWIGHLDTGVQAWITAVKIEHKY